MLLRSHGESPRYHHRIVGTTARLDALQAAILRVKLRHLDARNDDRRRLGAALRAGLEGTSVELPAPAHEDGDHVYHLFIVRTKQRDALRAHLEQHGVSTAVHYPFPIHRTEAYGALRRGQPARRRAPRGGDLHAAAVPDHVRRRGRPRDRGGRVLRVRGVGTDEPQIHPSKPPLRTAVVGYGYWGPNLVRNVIERPELEFAGLCERDAERAAAFSARYPGAPVFTDLDELLADPTIDAVLVATPPHTHHAIVRAALRGRQARARREAAGDDAPRTPAT